MIEAWFDGCCEPKNPGGHAAYGALVKVDGETVFSQGAFVCNGPTASNNVAEYSGILAILQWLDKYGPSHPVNVIIRGDSKLVINQLSGVWNTNCTKCGKPIYGAAANVFGTPMISCAGCRIPTPGLYFPFYQQARVIFQALKKRHKITLQWIPREQNDICDVLSKQVLKDRGIKFRIQPES